MKLRGAYAREYVYLICCELQAKEGPQFVYIAIDGFSQYIFMLGAYPDFTDNTYVTVVNKLLTDPKFTSGTGNFNLILGFGKNVHKKLNDQVNSQGGTVSYDPRFIIDKIWPVIQKAFQGKNSLRPVSLEVQMIDTWVNFLNPSMITNMALPKNLSNKSQQLLNDFKEQFVAGVDHITFVEEQAAEVIQNTTHSELEKAILYLKDVESHNGIFYIKAESLNTTSDFIYRLSQEIDQTNIFCIRLQGTKQALSVASFRHNGAFQIHTPSGMADAYNTVKLIFSSRNNKDLKVNYNPNAVGVNSAGLKLIPVAKHLFVSLNRE